MRVYPGVFDWIIASRVHRRFASRPGSEHIASRVALAHLSALLRHQTPNTILEFGAGIGTITYLLLTQLPKAKVLCTEHHHFCREQLGRNIPDALKSRLEVLHGPPTSGNFDLVIIDGGVNVPASHLFQNGTTFFVEGTRLTTSEGLVRVASENGFVLDLEQQPLGKYYLRWSRKTLTRPEKWIRKTYRRLRPRIKSRKTCKIGRLSQLAQGSPGA
jgi:hypothetical protein